MAWFKVGDEAAFHPKIVAGGNGALGAYVRMGAHSNQHNTGGYVTDSVAIMIATRRELGKMVTAGLLHEADGGYQLEDLFGNFSDQNSIEYRAEISRKRAEAGARGGKASGLKRREQAAERSKPRSNLLGSNEPHSIPVRSVGDQTPEERSHISGDLLEPGGELGERLKVDRIALKTLWRDKTGLRGEFVAGLDLAAARIEEYALVTRRDAMEIAAQALEAFAHYCDTRSHGYKPSKDGYKFVEHWGKIEPVLEGQGEIEAAPSRETDGPRMVTNLSFARKGNAP